MTHAGFPAGQQTCGVPVTHLEDSRTRTSRGLTRTLVGISLVAQLVLLIPVASLQITDSTLSTVLALHLTWILSTVVLILVLRAYPRWGWTIPLAHGVMLWLALSPASGDLLIWT
jgi:hypothetical protein